MSHGNMNVAAAGGVAVFISAITYIMRLRPSLERRLYESQNFQSSKDMYRERRNRFRNNPRAMEELKAWKARDQNMDYTVLTGLIPSNIVEKQVGSQPYSKCDTWFSEFESHNDEQLILSETADSYIIGNIASYDKRQYPQWFNPKFEPGKNTPEGQGFGHCLVIPRTRIFNIVDPEATENDAAAIKEMRHHFVSFWKNGGGPKLLKHTRSSFDEQNDKLARKSDSTRLYQRLLSRVKSDFEELSKRFYELTPEDFEFGFHAFPDSSVGHLHMHVFPKERFLRRFSTTRHDWKTIPFEAILEVEQEDKE